MKLETLLEDAFTRQALKLQQEFIEHLPDRWEVEVKSDGIRFSLPGATTAKIKEMSYAYIDDMGDRDIDALEAVVRDHLRGLFITPISVIGYKKRGSPVFDVAFKSVDDAVNALWDMMSVDIDSLRNASAHEFADTCKAMNDEIIT